MGLQRIQSTGRAPGTARGTVLLVVVGLHALAVAALTFAKISVEPRPVETRIEVALLAREAPELQRPPEPQLDQVPLPELVLPLIDLQFRPVEAPRALTVTAVAAPPPPPSPPRAAAMEVNLDVPVPVDSVEYLHQVAPSYPPQARRARAQGIVYLTVIIDTEGKPRDVSVHRSSGHQLLDVAARDAVLQFLFRPYRENGVARSARVIVPVEFSLAPRRS